LEDWQRYLSTMRMGSDKYETLRGSGGKDMGWVLILGSSLKADSIFSG
jgi:hypothetical protein